MVHIKKDECNKQATEIRGSDKMKDQTQTERNSESSISKLIFDNNKITDEQQLNRQQTSIRITKDDSSRIKKTSELSLTKSSADIPTFRGPFGTTTASTVLWYVCICILFVIAFLALVLSVLYFLNDSSTEQVIKLYGIAGSGSLAIITFVIIFLDCCNDGDREEHEEEAIYRILQIKETKDKELARRRNRRIATGRVKKPKPLVSQHQRPQKIHKEPHPHPYYYHNYPQPQHIHHIHTHSPISYHDSFACPVCHDSHASNYFRHNHADVGVDTSDQFEPVLKNNKTIHKSTHDAQTESKFWDAERGTQTDRTEGTQTSTMELSGMPNNITEVIRETTILKAPQNLLPALKESMEQQDKDIAISRAVTDTNSLTVADV